MSGAEPSILYLMTPMPLYWSDVLAKAKRYPFESLTGCPVEVECAEGMFDCTRCWAAAWPALRLKYSFGVFLDHLGGWVSRGVWAEVRDLASLGKPVWWFQGGEPTRSFDFGPPDHRNWATCYSRVIPLVEDGGDEERSTRTALARNLPSRRRRFRASGR